MCLPSDGEFILVSDNGELMDILYLRFTCIHRTEIDSKFILVKQKSEKTSKRNQTYKMHDASHDETMDEESQEILLTCNKKHKPSLTQEMNWLDEFKPQL